MKSDKNVKHNLGWTNFSVVEYEAFKGYAWRSFFEPMKDIVAEHK